MKRSEAKEGVRVRYTPVTNNAIVDVIDHCGTLEKHNSMAESGCYVKFDSGPKYYCNYRNLTVLEPHVQNIPSPIVTETRRYVKEGDYGILRVNNVSYVKGVVGLYLSPSPFGHYTAEQLRAAADVLNQIAEVLEENAS